MCMCHPRKCQSNLATVTETQRQYLGGSPIFHPPSLFQCHNPHLHLHDPLHLMLAGNED